MDVLASTGDQNTTESLKTLKNKSHEKVIILVGTIIVTIFVIAVFVFIRQKRKNIK